MSTENLKLSLEQTSDTIGFSNFISKTIQSNNETLLKVVSKILSTDILSATCKTKSLQGGTVGDVQLLYGNAKSLNGDVLPYKVVLKTQKKWVRYADENSWRREYDLYVAGMDKIFLGRFSWPICYHAEIQDDVTQIWMEYVEGVTGMDLNVDMCVKAAKELGRFQGKIYASRPKTFNDISNLSDVDLIKNTYYHYKSWPEVYDYIRSENCPIPKHICNMLIDLDQYSEQLWEQIQKLPKVLCHRDFWITNIIYEDNKIHLIDWDTTGWGYLGEDIASLISDEADINHMVECYHKCVPAYYKGFSEYSDISFISNNYIYELILFMFGYRLVENYKFSDSVEEKELQLSTLQKIYEIGIQSNEQKINYTTDLRDYGFMPTMMTGDKKGISARVVAVHKERYELICERGQVYGRLKSSIYYNEQYEEFPTIGDFVIIKYNNIGDSQIIKTLERKSKFSRNNFLGHSIGYVKTIKEQVVASNFDYVFIMVSLNHDFNIKRVERYLTQSWQSGGTPVVILTKSDLADDYEEKIRVIEDLATNVKVFAVSSKTGYGIDLLSDYLKPGNTIVLLGSSGIGKSSFVNVLAGKKLMEVKEIREDDSRGRHTTTHRQLIMLPSGAMIIDTPGMRELGMWDVDAGIDETFNDVICYFGKCKFSNCKHKSEPGCAIKEAIKNGELSEERWNSYLQIQSEAKFVNDKSMCLRQKDAKNKHTVMKNKHSKKSKLKR